MKRKNILDEMQEQKRLQIESNGFWIAFFGLAVVIVAQSVFQKGFSFQTVSGEFTVLVVLAIYTIPAYLKYGIWSTRHKPSFKTNCILSVIGGLIAALPRGITSYFEYGKLAGSIATAIFLFGFTFALILSLATLCTWLYNRRVRKLEDAPEDTEDVPQK